MTKQSPMMVIVVAVLNGSIYKTFDDVIITHYDVIIMISNYLVRVFFIGPGVYIILGIACFTLSAVVLSFGSVVALDVDLIAGIGATVVDLLTVVAVMTFA